MYLVIISCICLFYNLSKSVYIVSPSTVYIFGLAPAYKRRDKLSDLQNMTDLMSGVSPPIVCTFKLTLPVYLLKSNRAFRATVFPLVAAICKGALPYYRISIYHPLTISWMFGLAPFYRQTWINSSLFLGLSNIREQIRCKAVIPNSLIWMSGDTYFEANTAFRF